MARKSPDISQGGRDVPRARRLVLRYGWNAMAYQILNPGFSHWFSSAGDAVVGYVVRRGYRIVGGAPIAAPDRLAEVALEFESDAKRAGSRGPRKSSLPPWYMSGSV